MKATWMKPTLVVLSRGNPEEMVLEVCKLVGEAGPMSGPQGGQNKCDVGTQPGHSCGACRAEPGGKS